MVQIRLRDEEGCERQPQLLWDTIWVQRLDASGGYGDWVMAGPGDQPESLGGLRAEAALHTATMLCLFTDRRLPDDIANPSADGDPRGWWGDSIRLDGEPAVPLGSLLWTLERAAIDTRLAILARDHAEAALAVLVEQGAVARTEVEVDVDRARSALLLRVRHYSRAGERTYEQRFGVVWGQERRPAPMNFEDRDLILVA